MQLNVWDQQAEMEQQMKLLENSEITSITSDTINGTACYVVEFTPDMNDVWDQFKQFFDQLGLYFRRFKPSGCR